MESVLTKAYTIKIQNFEGPFDLLYHLIEKNKINLYDIPINDITDQYMEYLFAMQELDLEIASEFLLMAATLLHIKSKMLLPDKKKEYEEEVDPREELIIRLLEYKKYKEFTSVLKRNEIEWEKAFYKFPESIEFTWDEEILELNPQELRRVYIDLLEINARKKNDTTVKMAKIIQHEKVSLRSKMREIIRFLFKKNFFKFSELYTIGQKSKLEIVTGFLAILELSKLKKVNIEQKKQFSDILIHKRDEELDYIEMSENERIFADEQSEVV